MDFLKSAKGGPFELAGVRIPEGGGVRPCFQAIYCFFLKFESWDFSNK